MDHYTNESSQKGSQLKKLIRENKFYFVVLLVMLLWPPVAAILEVNKVENGECPDARALFPVGLIYNSWGYWPAVLFYPLLILALTLWIIFKFILPKRK